ncbi:hypothetical protein LPJ61_001831 [Coemansia biformis]|uniref:carnosine N-methyltransferase n=1 Tax=Coemansia biformis TaxID=1286918 RepID=A0A9W8D085_9FUNG|nr:hypothetical protein LPJ61_001831 [Coemansia biformis]
MHSHSRHQRPPCEGGHSHDWDEDGLGFAIGAGSCDTAAADEQGAGDGQESADESGSADGQESEASALADVVAAILLYKTFILNSGIYRRLHDIDGLSERHRDIVSALGTIDKIKSAEKLVRENYTFLLEIVHSSAVGAMPSPAAGPEQLRAWTREFLAARARGGRGAVKDGHMDKVLSTLKQFVRDWSDEGRAERDQTYAPLIDALEREFADVAPEDRGDIHVLVPGAGLGRLAFDICCRGFSSQGNEFSYFMLLASNFILNKSQTVHQHVIYPFVHQFSNVASVADQLRAVRIPDVLPGDMPHARTADFSMVAGDFIEVYGAASERERWDAIVTCFFVDTAKNVLAYLDTLWHAMKPGAVWINLGPLLWHFDGIEGESSIELTRDEFLALVTKMGFVLDDAQFRECVPMPYTANPRGMLQYTYRCFMCVARRPK